MEGSGGGSAAAPQVPRRMPSVEESGLMFLDEDPEAPVAEVPGPAAQKPVAPTPKAKLPEPQSPAPQAQAQAPAVEAPRSGAPLRWNADPAKQAGIGEDARRV